MLFDDHAIVLEQIASRLSQEGDIKLCQMSGLEDAVHAAAECQPDVVVIDPQNKEGYNLDLVFVLRQSHPDIKIIVLTAIADTSTKMILRRIGVGDVLEKGEGTERLLAAIRGG
jgi:two-component system nitrate/nitrite response regulator NarL